jgi:hypothetical protein
MQKKSATSKGTKKRDDLMSTAAAAAKLRISIGQFRRVTSDLPPAGTYTNPHYQSGPPAHLWSRRQVANLARRKTVVACRASCRSPVVPRPKAPSETPPPFEPATRARPRAAKAPAAPTRSAGAWSALFAQRYADPTLALGPAAEAMFELNRLTRSTRCAPWDKEDIFELKTSFVALLYRLEYTDRVVRFDLARPGQVCFECSGGDCFGDDLVDDGDDVRCDRCGGSGWWRPPHVEALYAFHFTVDGKHYSWMQPSRFVTFHVKVDEVSTTMERGDRAHDKVDFANDQLAEAKALVRWVVGRLRNVKPQSADVLLVEEHGFPEAAQ